MRDRIGSDELRITHEFVSEMLGVRRAGLTELAREFERQGFIESGRGRIRILDCCGLEGAACECYAVIRGEYDRLLVAEHETGAQSAIPEDRQRQTA